MRTAWYDLQQPPVCLGLLTSGCKDKEITWAEALVLPTGCAYGESNCNAQSIFWPSHQLSAHSQRVNEMTVKIPQRRKSYHLGKKSHYINSLMFALLLYVFALS